MNRDVEIDMVATHCQADVDCFPDLPYVIREYMRGMIAAPRPAVVLESVLVAGIRATLETLMEHDMQMRIKGALH